jgi:hypothetical protein
VVNKIILQKTDRSRKTRIFCPVFCLYKFGRYPVLGVGVFFSGPRSDLSGAQARARLNGYTGIKTEINIFPLQKERGEKNLLSHCQAFPKSTLTSYKTPVFKPQSKGRAIHGASFAFRGDK